MPSTIQFTKTCPKQMDCIVIPITEGKIAKLKDQVSATVFKNIKSLTSEKNKQFDDKHGSCVHFSANEKDNFTSYVLISIKKNASLLDVEKAGGKLYAFLTSLKITKAVVLDAFNTDMAASFGNGFYLRSYKFMKYKTKGAGKTKEISLKITCNHKANADRSFIAMKAISDAIFFARDVVSEPPNVLHPQSYVKKIKSLFKGSGVKVTVFDEKKLTKMGAGALLAVGKGSTQKPCLVTFEYDGRKVKPKNDKPLALVGKGVTYDTGGYSLKPRGSMEKMKMDMGGSAAVIGAIKALATNKEKIHVVGAVALAENMISGNAYRVDDVLVSLSGQTIEVINTDAEGRLCLADALTYVQDKYDPKSIIDVATLTGACMGALGLEIAGVFSNNKKMEKHFWEQGKKTGDEFWPLPVNDAFDKLIDSPIADMRNLGSSPFAGASTAAVFLQRFITDDRPWAHLDIAGTAWSDKDFYLSPKGATGFGVRALYNWVKSQ